MRDEGFIEKHHQCQLFLAIDWSNGCWHLRYALYHIGNQLSWEQPYFYRMTKKCKIPLGIGRLASIFQTQCDLTTSRSMAANAWVIVDHQQHSYYILPKFMNELFFGGFKDMMGYELLKFISNVHKSTKILTLWGVHLMNYLWNAHSSLIIVFE